MKTNSDSFQRSFRMVSTAVLLGMVIEISSPISTAFADEKHFQATRVNIALAHENADFAPFVPLTRGEGSMHALQRLGENVESGINWDASFWKKSPLIFLPVYDVQKRVQVSAVLGAGTASIPLVAIGGATQGVPKSRLRPQMQVMSREVRKVNLWQEFSHRLMAELQEKTATDVAPRKHRIRLPLNQAPTSLMDQIAPRSSLWQAFYDDRHRLPRDLSADTVVGFRIVFQHLGGNRHPNPPMTLSMEMEGRVIRVDTKSELKTFRIQHESAAWKFTDWSANEAAFFHAEWEQAIDNLVNQAGEQLQEFMQPRVPPVNVVTAPNEQTTPLPALATIR